MTEKRFDSIYYEDFCRVITDNGEEINPRQVVELLNALHEENIEYKQELEQYENIVNLIKEVEKMTEKRFTYDTGNLFDNKMNTFYQIEDSDENIELFCDNLNSLVEENERLKQEKQLLYENIDFLRIFIEKQGFKVKLDDKLFRVI